MEYQQEPSFRDLVDLIRRGLILALVVAVAAASVTFFLSRRLEPTYQARATLLASQPDTDLRSFGVSLVMAPALDVSAYRAAAVSHPVLNDALRRLGGAAGDDQALTELRKSVTVRAEDTRTSSLLHIEVRGESPERVERSANAVAASLLAWDTERATRNLQTVIDTLEMQIAALDAQMGELAAGAAESLELESLRTLRAQQSVQLNSARALLQSAVGRLEILEPALTPLEPVAPSPVRNAALAFVLGIFLTYGLLLLRDALDTRLNNTQELSETSDLPVLAEFPRQPGMRRLPREASNYLRTNILFATANAHPKVLLVTSDTQSQGKSSVALSLAESLARNDHRTLLVDADLRKPVLGQEYSLNAVTDAPLSAFLEDPEGELAPTAVRLDNRVSLDVIPSFGPTPNPSELLAQGFTAFLRRQMEEYDAIVIDSAPILPVADTLTIAPHVTGVVFAVSLPDSDRRRVTAALGLLERLGVRILGTVATNVDKDRQGKGEGYGYGYGYGQPEAQARQGARG